jgi:hypothetical protein
LTWRAAETVAVAVAVAVAVTVLVVVLVDDVVSVNTDVEAVSSVWV